MAHSEVREDLDAFRARARAWIVGNLEPLGEADPFMGHAKDEADQVVRAKAIQRRLRDGGFAGGAAKAVRVGKATRTASSRRRVASTRSAPASSSMPPASWSPTIT